MWSHAGEVAARRKAGNSLCTLQARTPAPDSFAQKTAKWTCSPEKMTRSRCAAVS